MLLSITTTHRPATDLGYLLRKNPARAASFDLAFGRAHVVYPEAADDRCTAALVLDIDPVGLVRGRRGPAGAGGPLEATARLQGLLARLGALVAVVADDKPYWVGDAEVETLLRHGAGWLRAPLEQGEIARDYLRRRGGVVRDAPAGLSADVPPDA